MTAPAHLRKYLAAWLAMLLVSVANGAVRDFTYGRRMSELAAHQLSTVISVVLLGMVIRLCIRRWPPASGREALTVGLLWLAMTVAFEFLFFHYAGGHSWAALLANYNVFEGRVWVMVLLWIALAPYLVCRFDAGR